MIIMNDRKKMVSQIMGDPEKEGPETGSLHVCMTEFIDAVHAKDVAGAESAFKACMAACEEPEPEGE